MTDPDARPDRYGQRSRSLLADRPGVRDSVTAATLSFDRSRSRAWGEIDADAWRTWAERVKTHALTRLDACLEEAEARLRERGAVVHWADTADEARDVVRRIVERVRPARAVKGKSMLSEEIRLDPLLESLGVEVLETDLGEFIIQLLDEPPSHIVGPAIHRSLADVRRLFAERLGTPADASPEALAARAREVLRAAFLDAGLGITGGNFLVAGTGSVVLVENEGNIRLTTSLPRVHVALVGIEKVLPRWSDVAGFLQLTARAATGQPVSVYASAVQGPRGAGDPDGPDELHVVLVDDGRAELLGDPEVWEALRCVRCGACLNVCPVFRQTGGHPYGWAYSGPIGAVLAPAYLGLDEAKALPYASTLCGASEDVCPVRIPLPELLHVWRRRAVERGMVSRAESAGMSAFAALARRPALFEAAGEALRVVPALGSSRRLPVVGPWVRERAPLRASSRSFRRDAGPGIAGRSDGGNASPGGGDGGDASSGGGDGGDASTAEVARTTGTTGTTGAARTAETAEPGGAPAEGPDDPRSRVLGRIVRSLREHEPASHPGAMPGRPDVGGSPVEAFIESFRRAGGEAVLLPGPGAASRWLESFQAEHASVAVGAGLPEHLRPGLPEAPPEDAALGVSRAVRAAADTGTLLLDSREGRAVQILPPVHLVWVEAASVRPSLAEAMDDAHALGLPPVLALHSGPSKSADIGRILVTGVHGPGRVVAAVVGDGPASGHPVPRETEPRRGA